MKFSALSALVAYTTANDQLFITPDVNQADAVSKKVNEIHKFLNDKSFKIDDSFSSEVYNAQDAATKKADLWNQVISDTSSGKFPSSLELPGLFVESMDPTFHANGDVMPSEMFGLKTRTKYIHSVGVVGKVKFVSSGKHPFTGMWEGSQHGLIRLSSAAEPSDSQPLAPGIALKLLRDGVEAADLVAMYGVNGTPGDWNFFEKDFSNHIGAADGTALKAVAAKFATETDWIQSVGLSNFGICDESGKFNSAPVFPFKMRFHPNDAVRHLIPNTKPDDYMAYTSQLEQVPANSAVYDVYGQDAPWELGGAEHFMGTIVLDGSFTKSKWGDEHLFFRHQLSSDDMDLKPEWKDHYVKYNGVLGTEAMSKCPYKALLKSIYGQ